MKGLNSKKRVTVFWGTAGIGQDEERDAASRAGEGRASTLRCCHGDAAGHEWRCGAGGPGQRELHLRHASTLTLLQSLSCG